MSDLLVQAFFAIRLGGLCGLVLAQRLCDGHIDGDTVLGLGIGSLVGLLAIGAVALLRAR